MALETLSYKTDADVVHQELPDRQSRTEIIVATGASAIMEVGTVLGAVTASGEYEALQPAASDGPQVASAILLEQVDARSAAVRAVALTRIATVVAQALIWPAGISAPNKAAALGQLLLNQQIVSRNGV